MVVDRLCMFKVHERLNDWEEMPRRLPRIFVYTLRPLERIERSSGANVSPHQEVKPPPIQKPTPRSSQIYRSTNKSVKKDLPETGRHDEGESNQKFIRTMLEYSKEAP